MCSDQTLLPPVLWAQRKDKIFLTIDVQDVKNPKIELTEKHLNFEGTAQDKHYHVEIEFNKEINPQESKYAVLPRHIIFNIVKKESGPFWEHLLSVGGKQWWLKADWSRWVEEEEEEGVGDFDMGGMGGMNFDNMGGDFGGDLGGSDDDDADDDADADADEMPPLEEEKTEEEVKTE
jgi:prostaglandin-E synthase